MNRNLSLFICKMLLPAICITLCAGCSFGKEEPKMRMTMGVPDGKISYTKVDPAGLQLTLLTKPEFRAGKKAVLTFALSNNNNRKVEIPEWLSREQDNVIVYVQPYLTGMKAPDPDMWTRWEEEKDIARRRPIFHYPLILMPGNKALVTKELSFIERLHVRPMTERRYFLKAELNLKSLPLKSNIIIIRILPNQFIRSR